MTTQPSRALWQHPILQMQTLRPRPVQVGTHTHRMMDQESGCGSLGESEEKGGGPWEMEGVV